MPETPSPTLEQVKEAKKALAAYINPELAVKIAKTTATDKDIRNGIELVDKVMVKVVPIISKDGKLAGVVGYSSPLTVNIFYGRPFDDKKGGVEETRLTQTVINISDKPFVLRKGKDNKPNEVVQVDKDGKDISNSAPIIGNSEHSIEILGKKYEKYKVATYLSAGEFYVGQWNRGLLRSDNRYQFYVMDGATIDGSKCHCPAKDTLVFTAAEGVGQNRPVTIKLQPGQLGSRQFEEFPWRLSYIDETGTSPQASIMLEMEPKSQLNLKLEGKKGAKTINNKDKFDTKTIENALEEFQKTALRDGTPMNTMDYTLPFKAGDRALTRTL